MTSTSTRTTKLLWLAFFSVGLCAVLFAFPAYSHAAGTSTASTTPNKKVDIACVQTAVGARETSVMTAWTAFSSSTVSALTARKSALTTAWGITDAKTRGSAIKQAWKDWRQASKAAHTKLRKDRKAAWSTFHKTVKNTCKTKAPGDEALGADAAGTISL